jgi:uncharacterized protein YbaP (TraB family)
MPSDRGDFTSAGSRPARTVRKAVKVAVAGALLVVAAIIVCLTLAKVREEPAPLNAPAPLDAPLPGDHALMWRATSPGGQELYLLGSLHMARTSFYPLKDMLYESFDRSGTLVLELDPQSPGLQNTLGIISEKGFYPEGQTLAEHLPPDLSAMWAPYADMLPGGEETSMRPWLAAVTLSVVLLEKMGYLVNEGVDRHFLARARERGMAFVELETPEEQLSIFADMSEEESLLFLKATLMEMKDVERFMDEMVDAWLAGDDSRFEEAFFSTYRQWPELAPLLEKVIFDRNRTMFERLKPVLEQADGPVFAVIGSGHLVGPRGMPAIFEHEGWRVEKF